MATSGKKLRRRVVYEFVRIHCNMIHCFHNGSPAVWFGQTIRDVTGQSSLIARRYHSFYQPATQWDGITGSDTSVLLFQNRIYHSFIHVIVLTFIIPLLILLSQSLLRHHSSRRIHKSLWPEVLITTKLLVPHHPRTKSIVTSWHSSLQHPNSAKSSSCLPLLVPSHTSLHTKRSDL